jgi:hypothetical protein
MNSSPLPQPSAYTCPNCGASIQGHPTLCPNCGASLQATTSKSSGCLVIGAQIFLGLLSVVLGLSGACFVLFGASGGINTGGGGLLATGLTILAVAGLCIWGIVRLSKR